MLLKIVDNTMYKSKIFYFFLVIFMLVCLYVFRYWIFQQFLVYSGLIIVGHSNLNEARVAFITLKIIFILICDEVVYTPDTFWSANFNFLSKQESLDCLYHCQNYLKMIEKILFVSRK